MYHKSWASLQAPKTKLDFTPLVEGFKKNNYLVEILFVLLVLTFFAYMIVHSNRVDSQSYKAATWEVQNQRTGEIGTGSIILNPNYKVQ